VAGYQQFVLPLLHPVQQCVLKVVVLGEAPLLHLVSHRPVNPGHSIQLTFTDTEKFHT